MLHDNFNKNIKFISICWILYTVFPSLYLVFGSKATDPEKLLRTAGGR